MCDDCRSAANFNWQEGGEDPGMPECEQTITSLRTALERLAKIDPFCEDELPFIDAARELEARMRFAEATLT